MTDIERTLIKADSLLSLVAFRYFSDLPLDLIAELKQASQECRSAASDYKGAVGRLESIAKVLDRGIPDTRKLATISRLVNEALASSPTGERSDGA